MPDAHSLPRWKRVFLCVSLLICLFTVNVSLFTVRAKANYVVGSYDAYVIGCPFDIEYYFPYDGSYHDGLISNASVYFYKNTSSGDVPVWVEGTSDQTFYTLTYLNTTQNADLHIAFNDSWRLNRIHSDVDLFFSSSSDLLALNAYMFTAVPFTVKYTFTYMVSLVNSDGSVTLREITDSYSSDVPTKSGNYHYYYFFDSDHFTSSYIDGKKSFINSSGERVVWMTSFDISFGGGVTGAYTDKLYFNSALEISSRYDDFVSDNAEELRSIYQAETISYDFDNVSWTDWLVNSVGAFMNFEIVPNLSLGGIFALLVGMSLFMIFLKTFAGG